MSNLQLSKDFKLKEFAVSDSHPELAKLIIFDEIERWKLFYLAHMILQPVRDNFNQRMRITSGKRSRELNSAIKGSSTSQHIFGEAADWVFANNFQNSFRLPNAYEYIVERLQYNWHQVILYLADDYRPRFIHVALPSLLTDKPNQAMLHYKGNYFLLDENPNMLYNAKRYIHDRT